MVNLFDIARQASHGAGFDALARQMGLDSRQAERAVEALLPAFSLAFQRSMLNPTAFAEMMGLVASGRYAPYFDGQPAAGAAAGDTLLERLFGSAEIRRQVAAQASAVTGIGVQVLQQMMPTLAATLVGGMFRYATLEGFADLLKQWSEAIQSAAAAQRPQKPAPADPWSAWMDVAGRMMGAAALQTKPPPPPDTPFDVWAKTVGSMLGLPKPEQPKPSAPAPLEAMAHMFETGREVQAQHLANLQAILGSLWDGQQEKGGGTAKPASRTPGRPGSAAT